MKPGLTVLNDLYYKSMRLKYPSFPISYIAPPKYKDTSANGLTKCIIEFLNMSGHQAERISNTGRQIDNRKTYSDTLGQSRTIGSITWIKGTGTNGTSDISATIKGRSVKVEVKIGKDKQSDQQQEYQKQIESAGGIYYLAQDFESFYIFFNQTFINKQDGL